MMLKMRSSTPGTRGAKQCLGAAGAILKVQPYHRWPLHLHDFLRHFAGPRLISQRQADRSRDHQFGAELQKVAALNAGKFQLLANGQGLILAIVFGDHPVAPPIGDRAQARDFLRRGTIGVLSNLVCVSDKLL